MYSAVAGLAGFLLPARRAGEERAHDRQTPKPAEDREAWSPETLLVHGGTLRSQFGETSEAMFLTQSFVYDTPSRPRPASRTRTRASSTRASPTRPTAMFEERMRLLEGAEAARATATGMAAVTSALLCFLKAGDHIVAGARHVRLVPATWSRTCVRASASPRTLVDGRDTAAWQRAMRPNTKRVLLRDAGQPDARSRRHRRRLGDRARGRRAGRSSTTCSPRR